MAYYYNKEFMETVIGKGPSAFSTFYQDFKSDKGRTNVVSGEDKIHDSIRTILSTRVGERFFVPEFGSKLYLTVFENNSMIFKELVELYTKEALRNWEKRVEVDSVHVGDVDDNNTVSVTIMYHFVNSNIVGSYIYPFNITQYGGVDVYSLEKGEGNISYV